MTRDSLDRFYTEQPLADAIVRRCIREGFVQPSALHHVLEPSSGRGAFVRAVLSQAPAAWVTAMDLDPGAERWAKPGPPGSSGGRVHFIHDDFLAWTSREIEPQNKFDLVIGNPPFGRAVEGRKKAVPVALEHVQSGLRCVAPRGHLVFLLRQSFAASGERYVKLFRSYKPQRIWNLVQRPSYTGDGRTDQHEYAVFIFGAEPSPQTLFDWLDWQP